MHVHLPNEFLLGLRAQIAMDGGLDLVELLDHILEVVCILLATGPKSTQYMDLDPYCRPCSA